ncbi:MAG: T9SS type A sorting domain-containing protein, partial [Bacteroidota bacterium]
GGGPPREPCLEDCVFQTRNRYELYFYPNPGRSGEIRYALQIPEGNTSNFVSLKIYDVLGREAATLLSGVVPTVYIVDEPIPVALPAGVYVYDFRAGPFIQQQGTFVVVR